MENTNSIENKSDTKKQIQTFMWDAISFEQWVRFFFLEDDPNDAEGAILLVSEDWVAKCEQTNPHLISLLKSMNNTPVNLSSSREHVISYVFESLTEEEKTFFQADIVEDIMGLLKEDLNFYSGFVQDKEEKLLENIAAIKQSKESRSTSKPKTEAKSKAESKSKKESKNASKGNGTDSGKDEKYIEDMQQLLQVVPFDAWMDEYKAYKIQVLNARS